MYWSQKGVLMSSVTSGDEGCVTVLSSVFSMDEEAQKKHFGRHFLNLRNWI
jgi:hypothetical protein